MGVFNNWIIMNIIDDVPGGFENKNIHKMYLMVVFPIFNW